MSNQSAIISTEKRLSKDVIQLLKKNMDHRTRISAEIRKHPMTFDRWIKANSVKLTTADCMDAISKITGIPQSELLQEYLPNELKQ